MKFIDSIQIAFSNLFRQKLRTLLTIFSIVIGATLISLVYAVIPGFENFLNAQFNSMNSPKLIEIYASKERPGQEFMGSIGSGPEEYKEGDSGSISFDFATFKDADMEKISQVDGVKKVHEIPMPTVEYAKMEEKDKRLKVSYAVYLPEFLQENLNLVAGEKLKDSNSGKMMLANQFVESFGYSNAEEMIGKTIILRVKQQPTFDAVASIAVPSSVTAMEEKVKDYKFEVVGITEKTILSSAVYLSYTDALEMSRFARGSDNVLTDKDEQRIVAWVELDSADRADEVKKKIEELGYSGMTYEESQNILNDIFGVLTIAFSSFGVLAMAVSSLGILNTLVMAVYERTREIGVMKAIGATKKTVALLFTLEAALIGLFGGLIGLGLGFGIAELLNIIGHKTVLSAFDTLDLSNVSSLLLLAPGLSVVVATIAGIYPAIRASKLDPVKALHYE
ncbi:MAG: FtsX-like permease family protein [Patescibacteria group bacterium]|nr:FtsX-like permease family protein [Patescibacteria group bacterium]